ncbi:MAG: DinB family protein [Acidobacteria bacterium]|nr:DinB family protein [Acidobacteriota bacterium]
MATPLELSQRLRTAVELELAELIRIDDAHAAVKTGAAWSPKEELGHLIDSAANNHDRIVRAALDGQFNGQGYAQDDWVRLHAYQELPWTELTGLWSAFNRLIATVVARIPADRMAAECRIGEGAPHTLEYVIDDYILHMQHHLDHILGRPSVRRYPRA